MIVCVVVVLVVMTVLVYDTNTSGSDAVGVVAGDVKVM